MRRARLDAGSRRSARPAAFLRHRPKGTAVRPLSGASGRRGSGYAGPDRRHLHGVPAGLTAARAFGTRAASSGWNVLLLKVRQVGRILRSAVQPCRYAVFTIPFHRAQREKCFPNTQPGSISDILTGRSDRVRRRTSIAASTIPAGPNGLKIAPMPLATTVPLPDQISAALGSCLRESAPYAFYVAYLTCGAAARLAAFPCL